MKQELKDQRYQEKLKEAFGDRYTLAGNFIDMNTVVAIRCNNCNSIQKRQAKNFLKTGSCRFCTAHSTTSRGEELIKNTLDTSGYPEYIQQYRVTLDSGTHLVFDFYYPSLSLFIEFQGLQHFDKDHFFMTEGYHKRDLEKKDYVKAVGGTLLEPSEPTFKCIFETLSPYFSNLKAPKEELYHNKILPIYQIYLDSREMLSKDVCAKYDIGSTKLDMIIKLYKDTEYEKPQVKTDTKYAPVRIKDLDSFKRELARVSNNRYDVLGKYKDSKTRILVHCHVCNQTYEVIPKNIVRPKNMESMGCKYCEGSYAKTRKQAQKLVDYMYPNQYVLPEDYSGVAHKIDILCTKCNTTSSKKPTQILTGNGCRCSSKRYGDNSSANPKMSLDGANKLLLKHLTD